MIILKSAFGFIIISCVLFLFATSARAVEFPRAAVMFACNINRPSVKQLSKYDIIVDMYLMKDLGTVKASELKALNNTIEILRTSQGPIVNTDIGSYGSEVLSAQGFKESFLVHQPNGARITFWDGWNALYNFANPEAVAWLLGYVSNVYNIDTMKSAYTGMYLDGFKYRYWQSITDPYGIIKSKADANGDGIEDTELEFDSAWGNGVMDFLIGIKNNFPNLRIIANDAPKYLTEYGAYINGAVFENEISYWLDNGKTNIPLWFEPWTDVITSGNNWLNMSLTPHLSIALLGAPKEIVESPAFLDYYTPWEQLGLWSSLMEQARTYKDRMRFGLGVSCLSGTAYSYDWGSYSYGNTYWWYPEYDANGRGTHYLGNPLSDPQRIIVASPASRDLLLNQNGDFETGFLLPWEFGQSPEVGFPGNVSILNENGNHFLRIKSDNSTSYAGDFWRVQTMKKGLSFIKDKNYVVSFRAKADSNRTIEFGAQVSGSPNWNDIFSPWFSAELSTEWREYTFMGKAQLDYANQGNALFSFHVAGNTAAVYVDNVKITEDAGIVMKRDFERGRVYVNPINSARTISLEKLYYDFDGNGLSEVTVGPWDATFLISDPSWCGYCSGCNYSAVRNLSTATNHSSVQDAYMKAQDNSVIGVRSTVLVEVIHFDRPISVVLQGGYDCGFISNPLITALYGAVTINNGTVTVDNIEIK